ncbi:MAG TPA: SagB/ThcOx family dehydrogenase [Nitrospinota bacterium]|nr:SagB/ThcOx family dehydrogenase [Nitrospinota bacterium]
MKKAIIIILILILMILGIRTAISLLHSATNTEPASNLKIIKLPEPKYDSKTSVEKALLKRRSVRSYKNEPVTLAETSQLLWAAQGITNPEGFRTAPSAGALYPLEVYLIAGNVDSLNAGIYKYKNHRHALIRVREGDKRKGLSMAAFAQRAVRDAALDIVISAVYERTTVKYRKRGIRYVHMEAGHAAQNIFLQAVSLNLGTVTIGAFWDGQVKRVVNMPDEEHPLYIIPVGRK